MRFETIPWSGVALTSLALLATFAIWNADPLVAWGYEIGVFSLTAIECLRRPARLPGVTPAWAAIALWGFAQLAAGFTVYRFATANTALQNLALAATAGCAFLAFRTRSSRMALLSAFCRISVAVSVVSVLAYWTSPGKILWIFRASYPDNWGPFPSRNNFAQFLELSFPVALFELGRKRSRKAAIAPAILLGAGLASSSRAGALILIAETAAGLYLMRVRQQRATPKWPRALVLSFALTAAAFAAVAGAGRLAQRFAEPDPLAGRREIFHAALAMIAQHPWKGFGLGTFASVYPQFAELDTGASVEHAHNDWLEWAAEGGLPYAAMWAALATWAVRPALRSVWGLGILAVFLHALVDYPFARLGVSAWVFLLLGLLARNEIEAENTTSRSHY